MYSNYTPKPEIPYGYCQCGCGRETNIAKNNRYHLGIMKGEHHRFIRGHHRTSEAVFWTHVDKSGGENACWIWTAALSKKGYGEGNWNGHNMQAHRISYLITHGSIPDGLMVLHNCPDGDNPSCVNPRHLWVGTAQDNTQDMMRKGRHKLFPGTLNTNSKFTLDQIEDIRSRHEAGKITQTDLAIEFHVSRRTIYQIVKYISYI